MKRMRMTEAADAHEPWMRLALTEAREAGEAGDVPVGAVLVRHGVVAGRGQNRVVRLHDPTAHAEMLAIQAAARALGYERLTETTLYVTLEPCAMCAGAMVLARIDRVVFGAADPKTGACGSVMDLVRDRRLNHRMDVCSGILADECAAILRSFFQSLRGAST